MYINNSGGDQLTVGYISVCITFITFIGILVFQLLTMTGIAKYLKRKCAIVKRCIIPIRDGAKEIESDTDSLPDRLINTVEYEPVSQNAQECRSPESAGGNESISEERRRLITVYTYSSLS